MNIQGLLRSLVILVLGMSLFGCGSGSEEAETSNAAAAPAPMEKELPPNPLAADVQTMEDAKGIQAMLDQDAAAKKKAIEDELGIN